MRKSYSDLVEGQFRFSKLSDHLDAHKCPQIISISEDATRIIRHIDYDENSNKLVGFVLPVDGNHLPLTDSFFATSFEVIEETFAMRRRQHSPTYTWLSQCHRLPHHFA